MKSPRKFRIQSLPSPPVVVVAAAAVEWAVMSRRNDATGLGNVVQSRVQVNRHFAGVAGSPKMSS